MSIAYLVRNTLMKDRTSFDLFLAFILSYQILSLSDLERFDEFGVLPVIDNYESLATHLEVFHD